MFPAAVTSRSLRSAAKAVSEEKQSVIEDFTIRRKKTSAVKEVEGTIGQKKISTALTLELAGHVLHPKIPDSFTGGGAPDEKSPTPLVLARLSRCLESIMTSNNPAVNCLGDFYVLTPSQLPDYFTLSITTVTKWHQSRNLICDQSRCLTLNKSQGKRWVAVGSVHLQCMDMQAMSQEWKLSKWRVPYNKFNSTLWYVMLGSIFEFLRQYHLKVLVGKGVLSLHAASIHSLRLVNDCTQRNDFDEGQYNKEYWRDFTHMSSGYEREQFFWRIPAQPGDYYRILLNCPGPAKSIVFMCPTNDT